MTDACYFAKMSIVHHQNFYYYVSCSQAIQLVLQYAPVLTVEYCLTYLPPQLDHWRDLLASLLDICTSHDQQGSSANSQLVARNTPLSL